MSSTEPEPHGQYIRDLFLKKLLPAASDDGRPRSFFPLGPDATAASYYVERTKTKMSREDFIIGAASDGDPIAALGELWTRQGHDRLAALAPELRQLAGKLRQIEKPADDVSPFIYVMF